MLIKLNIKSALMVLFLSTSLAHADGGLIFLEKNIKSQQETKAKTEKSKNPHLTCKRK
ncbi:MULTISPECIES: hypothetical protein [Acinetobacter]|nr:MULTISPECIES: hypothetical protein [Acinetobacter]ELW82369.1 hypothetical protein ACIN5021_3700 [Acinetobacter sp. OIFC021]EXE48634.1 hypothetical protein J576_3018 [Acinetobacter sp. 766875]MBJ8504907.1 hypothetical protein [Acinetobacter seifertii]MBR7740549.1 hypothetical protein [Acinetobacter nosocomialis]MBR7749861.1 hypothetical protein [Acinetobacter nosocomialis]